MLASEDLNRQPSITAGMLGLAILIAIFFAGTLVGRPLLDSVISLWERGAAWVLQVSTLPPVTVPSCPDSGGSWWFQGTLLCTTR